MGIQGAEFRMPKRNKIKVKKKEEEEEGRESRGRVPMSPLGKKNKINTGTHSFFKTHTDLHREFLLCAPWWKNRERRPGE